MYKLSKSKRKLLSLFVAFTMVVGLISAPYKVAFAEETTKATDLIISEYIEGSSNNKAIEIYNGTGQNVDLSQYKIELYVNGKTEIQSKLDMSGTLESGKTYVICHT